MGSGLQIINDDLALVPPIRSGLHLILDGKGRRHSCPVHDADRVKCTVDSVVVIRANREIETGHTRESMYVGLREALLGVLTSDQWLSPSTPVPSAF